MYNGATIRTEMLKYYVQSYNVVDGTSLILYWRLHHNIIASFSVNGLGKFSHKLMTHQLWYFYTFPTKYAEVWAHLVSSDRNVAIVSNLFSANTRYARNSLVMLR